MRVGLDITSLRHAMGGYERYVRSLLDEMCRLDDAPQMLVLTDRRYGPRLVPDHRLVEVRAVRTLPTFLAKAVLQDQVALPRLVRRSGLDVLHTPIFAGSARAPQPYVLTLHDVIPLRMPDAFSRSAAWYWRTILPRSVARADVVLTDSEFSRREIRERFRLAPERVLVAPLGVAPSFARVQDRPRLDDVRRRYRLPDEFLLFVGIASPRKNLARLVRAFGRLSPAASGGAHLVLAGPAGWRNADLAAAVAQSPVADRIHRVGQITERDLPAVYSLARAAVSVSLYEGFALPALEALACETPLVCADDSAYPELVGDCAIAVDPRDEAAITDALATVLAGGEAVDARVRRGHARAARFTWRETARVTLDAYACVARRRPP